MARPYSWLTFSKAIIAAWTCFGTIEHMTGNIQWRLPLGLTVPHARDAALLCLARARESQMAD